MPNSFAIQGLDRCTILTSREKEIMQWANAGLRNKAIADNLCISLDTVKKHLYNIFQKLQVCNKIEALQKIGSF